MQKSDEEVLETNRDAKVRTEAANFINHSQGITADPLATASAALSVSSETSAVQASGSTSAAAAALLNLSVSSATSEALVSGDNSQIEQIAELLQQAKTCKATGKKCFLWPGCWSPGTEADNTPGAKDIPDRYHAVGIANRYNWDRYLQDESIPDTDYLDFITRLEKDTIVKVFITEALSYDKGHETQERADNFLKSLKCGRDFPKATDKRSDYKRQALMSFSNVIKGLFETTHPGEVTTSEWINTFNEAIKVKKQSKGGGGGGGIKGTANTGSSKKVGGGRNSGGKAAAKKDGSGKGGRSDSQTPPSTTGNNNSGIGPSTTRYNFRGTPPSTTTSTASSAPASGTTVKVNRSQLTTLDDADIECQLPTLGNAINDAFKTELQGEELQNAVQQLVPSLKKFTEDIYSQKLDQLAGSASEIIIDLTEEV
jgi:hypothetical protein